MRIDYERPIPMAHKVDRLGGSEVVLLAFGCLVGTLVLGAIGWLLAHGVM